MQTCRPEKRRPRLERSESTNPCRAAGAKKILKTCNTILGSNGVIGYSLSKALSANGERLRQVSRLPRKVNEADEVFPADLLDPKATAEAIAGSDVAYLVAGLKYDTRVWQEQWPRANERLHPVVESEP